MVIVDKYQKKHTEIMKAKSGAVLNSGTGVGG